MRTDELHARSAVACTGGLSTKIRQMTAPLRDSMLSFVEAGKLGFRRELIKTNGLRRGEAGGRIRRFVAHRSGVGALFLAPQSEG